MTANPLEKPLALWVKHPDSYVRNIQHFIWRIKAAEKFGENLRGFPDGGGELVDIQWSAILKMRPTAIEINNSKNPFKQFVAALNLVEEQELKDFLSKLSIISVNMCDISATDLLAFLTKVHLLEAFSYSEIVFSQSDWTSIANELLRLNVRALDISSNVLTSVLAKLDIELVKLSGSPGIDTSALQECSANFVTVKTLIASELNFVSDNDAENFLTVLPSKFSGLSSLIWDWNMVDPAVIFDQRTKNIVARLIEIYKVLNLGMLAIIAYTPCGDTKQATGEIARLFSEGNLHSVDIHRFCSRGVELETPNFTLILAGSNAHQRQITEEIIAKNRNSIPNIRQLLPLLSPGSAIPSGAPTVVDFGGFDGANIRKTFENKKWGEELEL